MNESSEQPPTCARPGCTRPLDPSTTVLYIADGVSHYFHATCARSAASELGALALAAVNRARADGLAARVDAMERRWEARHQITKQEWHRRVREALGIG